MINEDEPYFVLRASDPLAPILVSLWARLQRQMGGDYRKTLEARSVATKMMHWHRNHMDGKQQCEASCQIEGSVIPSNSPTTPD